MFKNARLSKLMLTLALLGLLTVLPAGCGGDAGVSPQDNGASSGVDISIASDDDCFEWEGTVITGLTEKGRQQTNLVLPQKATETARRAFLDNRTMETVGFQNQDIILGEGTFYSCKALTKVRLPDNLKEIPQDLFCDCKALTEITIPQSVTKIGYSSFQECSSLETVTHGDAVEIIDVNAFYECTSLKAFEFTSGIKTIDSRAFGKCTSLESVRLNEGITEIGLGVFEKCENITSIVIPEGVEEIYGDLFAWCSRITEVQLPESLTCLSQSAFLSDVGITYKVKKGSYADTDFDMYADAGDKKEYY